MSGVKHSRRLAARIWWATLPYEGWTSVTVDDVLDGARPAPWYAYPLAWLHRLVEKLPSHSPFINPPTVVCNCDYCRSVPGARFEP